MEEITQQFTTRQYMVSPDFEIFHYKDEPSLEVEYHNHDFYEIYYLISGKVNYIIEGKNYNLKPGDILLINNKELHKPLIKEGAVYERMVVWVNPEFIRRHCSDGTNLFLCFETTSKNRYNLLRPGAEILSTIKNILAKLNKCTAAVSFGSQILAEIYLTELIVYLNRAYLETYNKDIEGDILYDKKVNDIIHYINNHLEEDLSLEILSERFYTSKYHLLRKFKEHTGLTLYNYIRRKRLIYAKTLVSKGIPITEVYQMCGFGDYSNFIRSFRNMYKISPKKYARQFIQ